MRIVPLREADPEEEFGGKAVSLGTALRAGLTVPPGFALSFDAVEKAVANDAGVIERLFAAFDQMKSPIAVRSSAVGEDSNKTSFAGQHVSILNVNDRAQLNDAIAKVRESAFAPAAEKYREELGIEDPPRMGVVLQELLNSETAGVLFTRNPVTGAEERVIEASWGLGEIVVAGSVIPDYFRLGPDGTLLECTIGEKDLALRQLPEGGTEEIEVSPERARARTLEDEDLKKLHELALKCEAVYGRDLDIEWGMAGGTFYVLQCRSITTSRA